MAERKKYAAYCMTRNIYHKIFPSLHSLLMHSDVDTVFLITEDDDIGYELPRNVRIINVSNQKYFTPDGVNFKNSWTYMVLIRVALSKVLPDIDRVLTLDLDTIVDQNINELWDLPIDDYYCAAAYEPVKSTWNHMYINGGVVLWNLKKMRDGKCDEMIADLNKNFRPFPDQECISDLCKGKIYKLPSCYNASRVTEPTMYPKIHHFAAHRDWYNSQPLAQRYK